MKCVCDGSHIVAEFGAGGVIFTGAVEEDFYALDLFLQSRCPIAKTHHYYCDQAVNDVDKAVHYPAISIKVIVAVLVSPDDSLHLKVPVLVIICNLYVT